MATKFFFPLDLASDVAPTTAGSWGYTSEQSNRKLVRGKTNSVLTTGTPIGPWTAGQTAADRRYVSEPLASNVTISGTVSCQLMAREYAEQENATSRLEIYVVTGDGATHRGTLLSIGQYGPATEYINDPTLRNKSFADGDTLSNVAALAGDRIVVVIGHSDASGVTPNGSCLWGDPSATSNLPVNETQTSQGCGWIEFSQDLSFEPILKGDAAATGAATGNLTVTREPTYLAGSAAGVGWATGNLTVTPAPIQFSGSAAGVGGATASVSLDVALAGSATGIGDATGALGVERALTGSATGIGDATGVLGVPIWCAGTATGVGAASGDLTVAYHGLAYPAGLRARHPWGKDTRTPAE